MTVGGRGIVLADRGTIRDRSLNWDFFHDILFDKICQFYEVRLTKNSLSFAYSDHEVSRYHSQSPSTHLMIKSKSFLYIFFPFFESG